MQAMTFTYRNAFYFYWFYNHKISGQEAVCNGHL